MVVAGPAEKDKLLTMKTLRALTKENLPVSLVLF